MTTDASPNTHEPVNGSGTNGKATSEQIVDPATTVAVSRSGSPPPADFSSAFQPPCSNPAPRTASVTPRGGSTARRRCYGGGCTGGRCAASSATTKCASGGVVALATF